MMALAQLNCTSCTSLIDLSYSDGSFTVHSRNLHPYSSSSFVERDTEGGTIKMRRTKWALFLTMILVVALVAAAYAAQRGNRPAAKPGSAGCPMMGMRGGPGMMGGGPGMMMRGPMGSSSMAVSDGYIYILAGNKLMKYTTDLKPVAETQIEMPSPPMMGGMGMRGGMTGGRNGMMGGKAGKGQMCPNCPMINGSCPMMKK
jgi:hypothetical protein